MATIYLSSTYEDLKEHRTVVFEALRKSGHNVIAMEDYVAADQRPVDKCLKDVEQADIYVGLFAFRYGYVPPVEHDNPKGLSITELEFRHAAGLKKQCLTFVVKDTTPWPPVFTDAQTSKDKGERINTLRQYLLQEKLASEFSSPYQLSTLVLAAVVKHLAVQTVTASMSATEPHKQDWITWDIERQGSPYPGLLHFTPKYASVFFGRDVEVRTILDRMQLPEGRFLLVSGDSGVGKSSIVAAGVLPTIDRTPLPGTTRCLRVRMVPSRGTSPFNALVGAFQTYIIDGGLVPEALEKDITTSPERLAQHLSSILRDTQHDGLVLLLDQMEELFTTQDPDACQRFITALYRATQKGALWVVATIRSDHLHYCHKHPDLLRLLRGPAHYPVGPIEPYLLLDLIVKPAGRAGLTISDRLARRIVHEMGAEVGHLPLLAFVLNQLFERRLNQELREAVYEQLGGIKGAIAHHAAQVEASIRAKHGANMAPQLLTLFQSLVILSAEGLPTRRRPLRSAFPSDMTALIDELVRERLLNTEGDSSSATVSISHEALFEAWPSLKTYVAENRKQLMDQTLLESRARKWQERGKPWSSGLAIGREYHEFQRVAVPATAPTRDYLRASQRLRWLMHGTIGAVMVLIGVTTWLWQKGYSVDQAVLKSQSFFVRIHMTPDMQPMPAGIFRQGDFHGRGNPSEQPVHQVNIKAFAIGKFEVTFEEYDRFAIGMNRPFPNDLGWGRGRRPVINVSWHDAKAYAEWLSKQTGKLYRLPTESEWEYAARSGENGEFLEGADSEKKELDRYAVYAGNSKGRTAPVGRDQGRQPNALGVYDMIGNVHEWVEDCKHDDYEEAPLDGTAWLDSRPRQLVGYDLCDLRVIRGGGWDNVPVILRPSFRGWHKADAGSDIVGFRLVQDLSQ